MKNNLVYIEVLKQINRSFDVFPTMEAYMINRDDILEWYNQGMIDFKKFCFLNQENYLRVKGESTLEP